MPPVTHSVAKGCAKKIVVLAMTSMRGLGQSAIHQHPCRSVRIQWKRSYILLLVPQTPP